MPLRIFGLTTVLLMVILDGVQAQVGDPSSFVRNRNIIKIDPQIHSSFTEKNRAKSFSEFDLKNEFRIEFPSEMGIYAAAPGFRTAQLRPNRLPFRTRNSSTEVSQRRIQARPASAKSSDLKEGQVVKKAVQFEPLPMLDDDTAPQNQPLQSAASQQNPMNRSAAIGETQSASRSLEPQSTIQQPATSVPGPSNNLQATAWWLKEIESSDQRAIPLTVEQVVVSLLMNSPSIRAIQQEPIIASTFIEQENARFDPISFMESKWQDTNDPVGNTLTTSNSPFLKNHTLDASVGFRKQTQLGTEIDLQQAIGFKNSNSEFFQPQDQGTARLELNIDQPLLRGAGRLVGTSRVLMAHIDSRVADSLLEEKLQNEILEVIQAYWDLHFQKSIQVIRANNLQSAVDLLKRLEARGGFDALKSQVIRAQAAVASRRIDLIRTQTDAGNASTRIRELTRDPALGALGVIDGSNLVPAEHPLVDDRLIPDLPRVVQDAFENRPEIRMALNKLKAAGIENDVAKNQLLPQLSFIFNAYTAALNGDSGIEQALQRQLTSSTPGYSTGFVFEYPIYNRAAAAKKRRVEAQMTKLSAELDDALGSVSAEVEIAFRELRMTRVSLNQAIESLKIAKLDRQFIQKRWENFAFLENQAVSSPTILLEQLLDAQDRIAQAEIQYVDSSRNFMVAVANLKKADGSLLNLRNLNAPAMNSVIVNPSVESIPDRTFPNVDDNTAPSSDSVR